MLKLDDTPETRTWHRVAREALVNSQRFHKEARGLLRQRSWGHAMALDRLALEELAKAIVYARARDGVTTFSSSQQARLPFFDQGSLSGHKAHKVKWGQMAATVLTGVVFVRFVEIAVARRLRGTNHAESLRYAQRQIAREAQNPRSGYSRQIGRVARVFQLVSENQNAAFYVDLVGDRVVGPKQIRARDARFVHERIRRWLIAFGPTIDPGLLKDFREEMGQLSFVLRQAQRILAKQAEARPRLED